MNYYEIFQKVVETLSVWCLMVIAGLYGLYLIAYLLEPIVRWIRAHKVDAIIVAPFVICLIYTGATKNEARINYPRTDPEVWYLMDNGSYVTNDAVHVAFTRNLIVPNTASFYIYGLELSYTNESDWAEHSFLAYEDTFGNMTVPFDMPFEAATNYNWMAFTDWTPPPVTHTNGVAYVAWQIGAGKSINDLVPYRTGIYTNSVRVAPSPAITNGVQQSAGNRGNMEATEDE